MGAVMPPPWGQFREARNRPLINCKGLPYRETFFILFMRIRKRSLHAVMPADQTPAMPAAIRMIEPMTASPNRTQRQIQPKVML